MADGRLAFSKAEAVTALMGVTVLRVYFAADQPEPLCIQLQLTVEGASEEITGFARGMVCG